MLRGFRLSTGVKKTMSSPSWPPQIAVELGEPSLVRVARWTKFAPSNSARTSGGSSAIGRAYPLDEGRLRARAVAGGERGAPRVLGHGGPLFVARVDGGEPAGVLAQAGDVGEADRVVDVIGLAPPAAAQLHHHEAERADVDGPDDAPRGHLAAHGCLGQVAERAAERVDHPLEALRRGARGQRLLRVGVPAGELERGAGQRDRDLEQPRLAPAVAEDVERLAHLERVA